MSARRLLRGLGRALAVCAIVGFLCHVTAQSAMAQTGWIKNPSNPVVTITPGDWDGTWISEPCVIFDEGIYKMWYAGNIWGSQAVSIGYATSVDGVTWVKHGRVLSPIGSRYRDWEAQSLHNPSVIRDGGILKMWYSGHSGTGGQMAVGYATSADGIRWTRYGGNPVIPTGAFPGTDEIYVGHVAKTGASLTMWYTTWGHGDWHIRYATSNDGISWLDGGRIVSRGPDSSWDGGYVGSPSVLQTDGGWELWYTGGDRTGVSAVGHAFSADGVTWVKDTTPVMRAAPGTWDSPNVGGQTLLSVGRELRMWYNGGYSAPSYVVQIGLATYEVTSPNAPPTVSCPESLSAECAGADGTLVTIPATVEDLDGDELEVIWTIGGTEMHRSRVVAPTPTVVTVSRPFAHGETIVTITVSDGTHLPVTCSTPVTISDTTRPVIVLNGDDPMPVACPGPYVESGATVTDTCDASPTLAITGAVDSHTPGEYTITYTATDASGNKSEETRRVIVSDTTPPVIVLNGDDPMTVECPGPYVEPGASVTDTCDASPTLAITGAVDSHTPGEYIVTYTATDASGNKSEKTRAVIVQDTAAPAITASLTPTTNPAGQPAKKGAVPAGGKKPDGSNPDGFYLVRFSVSDTCDKSPTVSATISGYVVADGEIVKVTYDPTLLEATTNLMGPTKIRHIVSPTPPALVVVALDASGNQATKEVAAAVPPAVAVRPAPSAHRLLANYPNPFNPETWIPFELKEGSAVTVNVYDVAGALVRKLDVGYREPGYYTSRDEAAYWDGRNELGERVASGVYFYELRAGSFRETRRMVIHK
ncbi:DUF5011 domain-containing protein [Candidatus Poribacteria bacterium]|nr:DUF5011 domain-containing protein [Candidatus Poribacteria bacterium]